jgi:DNA-binding XRE family transcriptional regulator
MDDVVRHVRVATPPKLVDVHATILLDLSQRSGRSSVPLGRSPGRRNRVDVRNMHVTATLKVMTAARTGAERYLAGRLEDPEYRRAYEEARERVQQIDSVIRAFDARREELHITKAELARRAGVKPEAIRRLFSAEKPNPTLTTLVALAGALDLEILPTPRRRASTTRARSAASGTRRRSA